MVKGGLGFNLFYYIFNFVTGIFAVYLLLKVKDATNLRSYGEQAYYCFGKASITIVNVFVFIAFGILPIAYFNIFADLMAGLVRDVFKLNMEDDNWYNVFGEKLPWVLFDGLCLIYLVLKK